MGRTPVAFQPPAEADPAAASASLEVPFEGQYPVPNGSTLTLTAEVTDDQGLRYCIPLATFPVGQNGMLEQQGPPEADPNEPTQIYTPPQGALLWQGGHGHPVLTLTIPTQKTEREAFPCPLQPFVTI